MSDRMEVVGVRSDCEQYIEAKIKFVFSFRTTVVLQYEMSHSIFSNSSVLM